MIGSAAGTRSTTADRCRGVAPSTRSHSATIAERSWRAVNCSAAALSRFHGASSARESGCMPEPTTARTPALETWNADAARPPSRPISTCRVMISANGERQMFPVHT